MKRILFLVLMAATVILAAQGDTRGKGCPMGMGRPQAGQACQSVLFEGIDLTTDQKAKFAELDKKLGETRKSFMDKMASIRKQTSEMKVNSDADYKNLRGLQDQSRKLMDEFRAACRGTQDNKIALLSPEQKQKYYAAMNTRRAAGVGEFSGCGRGGMRGAGNAGMRTGGQGGDCCPMRSDKK